jgi:hypothetical protein
MQKLNYKNGSFNLLLGKRIYNEAVERIFVQKYQKVLTVYADFSYRIWRSHDFAQGFRVFCDGLISDSFGIMQYFVLDGKQI